MYQENLAHPTENLDRYKERISNFSSEFELGLFLYIARRNMMWVIVFFTLAIASAYLYLRYTPPVFEAGTVMQIKANNSATKVLNVTNVVDNPNELIEAVELLRSKTLFIRTLNKLPLKVSYFTEGTFRANELYIASPFTVETNLNKENSIDVPVYVKFLNSRTGEITYTTQGKLNHIRFRNGNWFLTPQGQLKINIINYPEIEKQQTGVKKNLYFFRVNNIPNLLAEYYPRLEVRVLNEPAKTVKISFKDNNAPKTADVVRTLANEFIAYDVEKKSSSSSKVLDFIDTQLVVVYNKLKSSEIDIQSYKKENKLNYSEDFAPTNISRLSQMEDEIIKIELQENILNEIQKKVVKEKDLDLDSFLSMLSGSEFQSTLSSLINSLRELMLKRQELLYEATPDNDAVKIINWQIESQRKMLVKSLDAIKSEYSIRKQSLVTKAREFESKYFNHPGDEIDFSRMQRLFAINEKFYTLLLEKRTEYSISKVGFVSQNDLLDSVGIPGSPVSPERNLTIISFVLVALLVSLGLILFKYLIHNEINSLNEIVKQTNASVSILGIVPKYSKEIPVSQLLVDKSPKSLIAEAFRSIRTNLQFISNEPGPKLMAVTSTISGEGKTFVAINLAGIIAFSGKKVIILDLDMRKPKIHIGFGASNTKGMSTILINKDSIDDCIQHSGQENLHFITAGPIPPNPSELIISKKMDEIISHLKTKYDMVIIDTPPVGLVTDGIAIIQKADYPIYIFRAEYSKRNFIQNVDRLHNENKLTRLSIILNGVDINRKAYGYNYGYGYGYGYGSGYGYGYYDDSRKKKPSKL